MADKTPSVDGKAESRPARRRFLGAAASGVAGAAALTAPMISVAQSPIVLKMQGAWGAKDIFNEMAEEYVQARQRDGRWTPAHRLSCGRRGGEAVRGDGRHGQGRDRCGALGGRCTGTARARWRRCSARARSTAATPTRCWRGSTAAAACRFTTSCCRSSASTWSAFFAMPMPTQPLGWFKKPIKGAADLKGLKYRTVGLAADLMQEMGSKVTQLPGGEIIPAMERGVIDAFEFNNPTSDRRFGAQDVAKNYMMGSYHQAMEFFEIDFNKKKWDSIPKDLQAILQVRRRGGVARRTSRWRWTSTRVDLQELKSKDKVNVHAHAEGRVRRAAQVVGRAGQEAVRRGSVLQEGRGSRRRPGPSASATTISSTKPTTSKATSICTASSVSEPWRQPIGASMEQPTGGAAMRRLFSGAVGRRCRGIRCHAPELPADDRPLQQGRRPCVRLVHPDPHAGHVATRSSCATC